MTTGIQDIVPGDYVKVGNQYKKIASISGVSPEGWLAPPSKGGFSVTTITGQVVSMYEARSYHKASEIDSVEDYRAYLTEFPKLHSERESELDLCPPDSQEIELQIDTCYIGEKQPIDLDWKKFGF